MNCCGPGSIPKLKLCFEQSYVMFLAEAEETNCVFNLRFFLCTRHMQLVIPFHTPITELVFKHLVCERLTVMQELAIFCSF